MMAFANKSVIPLYLTLVLLALFSAVSAATGPQSFCKCTCFSNSSIIELDRTNYNPSNPESNISCNDCTRKFCLEYAQPACEGAKEEDITTECFRRDSNKDKVIVYLFVFTVICLLGYAAIKPKADKWFANVRQKQTYMPLFERRIGA
ncbi:hypothetical protein AAP_03212 [Ascosphaera apis ARSEF 7405]|uniref:Uncharacterized protein n=1 Tax=Ascosphaera apis ARSEF 7405 TaxID=392613 RepID=A0A162IDT6_9EURO|nr:hypothetical protein AAP_03212 [Ascosphaera apis ARSEF 7405]